MEQKMNNFHKFYKILIQYDVATKDEINLVTSINGKSEETLLDILYVRTGCRNFDSFLWEIWAENEANDY